MAGEPDNLFDVGTLRVRRQVADLHVLDHATAKWAHRQLLCETNSATWRRRMVSQSGCQTRERRAVAAAGPTLSNLEFVDRTEELPRSGLVQRALSCGRLTGRGAVCVILRIILR